MKEVDGMAARKYSYNDYVHGSTARKLNTDTVRENYQDRNLRMVEETRKQPANHPIQSFDIFSMLFMTACVGVTLYFCISYIQVQHNITTLGKQIAIMESDINDLKNLNDAAYNRIDTSVDLSYVYDVAINELGMVRADQNQIRTYSNVKSDFVRQYGEIPDEKKNTLEQAITNKKK